jgi:hypothetical protein
MHWTEDYVNWTAQVLGAPMPTDFRANKLNSWYRDDSEWFKKAFAALFAIELEYAEALVHTIRCDGVVGAFAEFGVFQGAWINKLYEISERAGLGAREIWGFDSFAGLSPPNPSIDGPFWKEGMYAASRDQVAANVSAVQRPRIRLVEGFFADSLTSAEAAELGEIAYARIDCDLYEPTVDCLTYLGPRLSNGSILVFDDWAHHPEFGETRAFFEWVPTVPHLGFEFLALGPWDHCYIRVRHKG